MPQLADRARLELARTRPRIDTPARAILFRPSERFTELAFSPNSASLALAGDAPDAVVIGLDGKEKFRVRHNRPKEGSFFISSVAFDPSGRRLLTSSPDNTARIWDATSGAPLMVFSHDEWVRDAVFSSDGKLVATGGGYDCYAIIWDVGSGKEIQRISQDPVSSHIRPSNKVLFSPDGRIIVTANGDTVHAWEISEGEQVLALTHPDSANKMALSPDGSMLATGCRDGAVRIWDMVAGSTFLQITLGDSVYSVAFSPDGRMLAGVSGCAARIWDATTGDQLFEAPPEQTDCVAFSHNGRFLATAGNYNQVVLWRLAEDP